MKKILLLSVFIFLTFTSCLKPDVPLKIIVYKEFDLKIYVNKFLETITIDVYKNEKYLTCFTMFADNPENTTVEDLITSAEQYCDKYENKLEKNLNIINNLKEK